MPEITSSPAAKAQLTRREMIAAAAAMLMVRSASALQLPPPEPLLDARLTLTTTTEAAAFQKAAVFKPAFSFNMLDLNVASEPAGPAIEGFGGCFNELGWVALSALRETDREAVMQELFDPHAGARFNYCRMPIGANDYATEAYSYDEVDGDFPLQHFSIAHDRKTLIPFIKAAQKYRPDLRLWASPWSPPAWMKRNHFYAEARAYPGFKENGIKPEQIGHEGEDMFRLEPAYLDAYARYFGKFIDAYALEGIGIGMVMPQNEFNSAQNFPSCTWTPTGLAQLLERLGPEMAKRKVDIFFGTLERGNPRLLEAVMTNPAAAACIKGVGVQWAGKNALPALHQTYPALKIYQSEQECGDGSNSWQYTGYCWQLMKDYFRNGTSAYMYWNIATPQGGVSTWGWPQNSLVSVDTQARTYTWNHDYYLLKHLTHFVDRGARLLATSGTCDDALVFRNPDGSLVALLRNELPTEQLVQVAVGEKKLAVQLAPNSISTLTVQAGWLAG